MRDRTQIAIVTVLIFFFFFLFMAVLSWRTAHGIWAIPEDRLPSAGPWHEFRKVIVLNALDSSWVSIEGIEAWTMVPVAPEPKPTLWKQFLPLFSGLGGGLGGYILAKWLIERRKE